MGNGEKGLIVVQAQDQTQPVETKGPKNLQKAFEQLLVQYRRNGGKPVEKVIPFTDGPVNELEQKLFVRPPSDKKDIPDIGLELKTPQGTAEYKATYFVSLGHPVQPGVTVGELHFTVLGRGRGVSIPSDFFRENGIDLSKSYDAIIMRATANIFQRPILHTLRAEYNSLRMKELITQGYQIRRGYPEFLDRIFQPQGMPAK